MDFNAVFIVRFLNEWHLWRYELQTPHLISVPTLPCESQNTENVTLQWDITKENCIRCIIASSKWTSVIMCLKFTYTGCYTAKRALKKDSSYRRPAKTLYANLFWIWPEHHQRWRNHLKSCVYAGGGHFEHMLWHECSFYETANVICVFNGYFVVNIKAKVVFTCIFSFSTFTR